mgnify:CR=1 FL=1
MIRALRLLLYLILGLVVVVGLVLVFIATPPGRAVVASLVERAASGSGLTLSIGRLSGWPPFAFGADHIVVGDSEGPFAEIDGLSVDLAVGGLLRREIVFDSLSAERVAVLRQPILPPSEGGGGSTMLPLIARDFSVGELTLGEALVGRPAVLAVNGAFSTGRDGSLSARLDARRIDGHTGIVAAQVDRASAAAPLMIDATVEEGDDGILVGLIGRDTGPAYRLQAKTGLDDGALDGTLTLTSDGNARFAGRFALAPTEDGGQRLTLDGEGDLAELVPPGFASLLSGAIRIAVDVDWRKAPGDALPEVTIHDGRLDTGAIRAQASGSFGSADSDLTLRVQVSNPDGGGFTLPLGGDAPLAFDSVDLSGRVAPADGMTRLDLIGRVAGLSTAGVSVPAIGLSLAVEADGSDPLADTTLPFAFRAEADSIDLGGRVIPGGDDTPLVASAQGTIDLAARSAETTAEVTFAGGRLTYAGNIGIDAVTGRVEADYQDVATLAGLFDQPLRGRLSASAEGRFAGGDGLDIRVATRIAGLDTGIAALEPLLGPDVTIGGTVTDGDDGRIVISDLSVTGSDVTLSGNGSLDGSTVDATLTGRIADLGVLADAAGGAAEIEARVTGDLSGPEIDATVRIPSGTVLDQPVEDASVHIAGVPVDAGWQGTLTLGGAIAGQPVSGTATARAGEPGITVPAIDLTIAGNRITGALGQAAGGLFTGSLDIAARDLASLTAIAPVEASGALDATVTLTADNGRQDLAVSLGGSDIVVEGVNIGHLEGEANVSDLLGTPDVIGRVDLGSIAAGTLVIDTAALTARLVDGVTAFEVSAAGPDLQISGAGSLATEAGATTVRIETLDGTAFDFPVDLASPATVAIADGITRLSDVALAAGGGAIRISGSMSPNLDLAVAIEAVAASFVNAFVPGLDASGTISGSAQVTGTTGAPAFEWTVAWTDFAIAAVEGIGLPPLTVTARGEGTTAGTSVDARAEGGGLNLTATGNVPFGGDDGVRIDVDGQVEDLDLGVPALAALLSGETTLSATVTTGADGKIAVSDLEVTGSEVTLSGNGSLDGDTIDATLTGRIADLGVLADATSGAADIEARVTGTLAGPDINATVRVADGMLLDQPVEDASVRVAGSPTDGGWQGTLTLGGTIAGQPLSGTATALAGESGITLPSIDLTVAENRITGALDQTPEGLFTGSLDIAAPDLATLAAVALVEATGALDARATLTADDGRQDLAVTFGGNGIAVEGITVGRLAGEATVADLLGTPAITGRVDLGAIAAGSLVIDTATLSASVVDGATEFDVSAAGPDLRLAGAGSLDTAAGATTVLIEALEGTAFGFPVDLASPATVAIADGVTRLSGVALSAGGGEIRVAGSVSPTLDLAVEIDSVSSSFVNAIAPGLDASGTINGSARVTGTTDAPAFEWTVTWTDFAVAAADSIGLPPVTVSARGQGTTAGTSVEATAEGGGLDLTATGNVPFGGDDGVRIDVEGRAEALDLGQPALAGLLSGETTLSATVTTGAGGELAVSDIAIGGTGLNLTGDISLAEDSIDATVDGRIADLSALAPDSSGAAEFNARISGSLAKPEVDATVRVPEGLILGQPVDGASVSFTGAPTDAGGWDGELALSGNFAGHPLSGTAQAELAASGGLSLPEVDLRVGENRISGAITRTAAGLLNGSLDISAPNLASLAALALVEATGTAEARVVFTPDGDRQSVSASISGRDISMPSVVVGRIEADVQVEDALGVPMVRGSAEASGVDIAGTRIDTARVTATVENGATEFQASARGPDLDLNGAGSLAADGSAQVVRIDRLTGSAFGFPVNLAAPATIRMDGGETTISGANLAVGGGTVRVDGSIGEEIAVDAVINQVSGAFIDRFANDLGAEGTISGRATVTGTPAAPRVQWRIDWAGFNIAAARNAGVPAMALNASGVASGTATTVDARLAGGGVSLAVTGNVPYAGPGLQVRAQGTAPIALVSAQLGNDIAADGTARIDVSVTGSTANPLINGTFDLVEVRVADASDGIGVAGINGRITFDGTTARIERMTGRLTQGGNLSVAGTIGVNPAAGIPANLTIRITDGRYLDGVMINASFNADLTIVGPLTGGATIAGVINLGRTEVLLPDSFGGGPPITVEHIRTAPGFVPPMAILGERETARSSSASGGGGGFNLGLTINSTNAIFVRGYGLDAELGGSLRVEGTTSNPVPIGGFEMRRGRIEVLGRRFDFDRGILTFQGDFDPVLDFVATTTTADIVASISVTGPANDPEIVLTSVPSLPEEEIVSRILFGRSIGSLSTFQAVQLVDAIASFSGAFGRDGGVFARVRRLVGVDDLDIQQNATGGTTIGVGKRLSENLRVGVQTDTDGTSSITLDVDLTNSLKAQIEGGADGTGSVGLTFEKEY